MFDHYEIPQRYLPMVGEMIDNYRIVRQLGEGSFGNVYEAVESGRPTSVALKLLKLWSVTYEEERKGIVERFGLEYETGRIESRYLVHTLGYGKALGNPYILMEFCPNGDLRSRIGNMADATYYNKIGYEILLGLHSLHLNGKVHRDLKPDNVLIDSEGTARLTDFGIAGHKNIRMTKKNIFGEAKELFGTYAYMPPEQLKPKDATKLPTTDIFSFGVMMFEIMTGRLPFGELKNESDLADYVMRINTGKFDPLQKYRPDLPDYWSELLEKCLHPDYRKRYQSTEEIVNRLGRTMSEIPRVTYSNKNEAALQVMQGEDYGQVYNLSQLVKNIGCNSILLGRKDSSVQNDIEISEEFSSFISRRQSTIEYISGTDSAWYIKDGQWVNSDRTWKSSLNGTWVNSNMVSPGVRMPIFPNDIITVGDTTLKVILV